MKKPTKSSKKTVPKIARKKKPPPKLPPHPLESFKTQLMRKFEVTCDDDEEPIIQSASELLHIAGFLSGRDAQLTGEEFNRLRLGFAETLVNRLNTSITRTPSGYNVDPILTAFYSLASESLTLAEFRRRQR